MLIMLITVLLLTLMDQMVARMTMLGTRIVNISPTQTVTLSPDQHHQDQVQLDCLLDGKLSRGMELAWVKLGNVGEEEYLTVFNEEMGNMEYDEDMESFVNDDGDGDYVYSIILQNLDSNKAGLYQCQVLLNNQLISSREVALKVKTLKPKSTNDVSETFVYVKHGGNITLECHSDDNRDQGMMNRKQNYESHVLKLDRGDSGIYNCWVSDRAVDNSIVVQHRPEIGNSEVTVFQTPGHNATLQCHVSGVPVPHVSWMNIRTGDMVRSSSSHSVSISDFADGFITSSLQFFNISTLDYGQYSCYATNYLGDASLNYNLKYSSTPVFSNSAAHSVFVSNAIIILFLSTDF